jgi:acetyl-CoA carboxylase biotin carboxyl carrier protein
MTEEQAQPMETEPATTDAAAPSGAEPAAPAPSDPPPPPATDAGNASLLSLVDRLGGLLERSDLTELEVEVGGTALVLRKPAALDEPFAATAVAAPVVAATPPVPASTPAAAATSSDAPAAPSRPAITAPLTGIWYASPAPGSAPFVEVGREVAVGQVVGLIEAMKLFNEIVAEQAGVVRTICLEDAAPAEFGQLLFLLEP